jgi:predicted flap endonuclease-1-like 5' DNA nuclease
MSKKAKSEAGGQFPPGVAKPAQRALASVGVTRLDQVTRFTRAELMELHGMGPKALQSIEEALRRQGKSLAG